jgi:glycine/D-amino acid oxidase-like deaminating enzyme
MWPQLEDELEGDLEWVRGGNLALAATDDDLANLRAWVPQAASYGIETKILTPGEIRDAIPQLREGWAGALYTPSDGHAEPQKAAAVFANAARRCGASIREGVEVRKIVADRGVVRGVATGAENISAAHVVCAAGTWSARLLRSVALFLPELTVRATVAETEPRAPITKLGVWGPGIAFRQRPGGSFYIAPAGHTDYYIKPAALRWLKLYLPNYLKNRKLFDLRLDVRQFFGGANVRIEPFPNAEKVKLAQRNFAAIMPQIGNVAIGRTWAGDIDAMPDGVPVIGDAESVRGLHIVTGFSGHGFAMGPIVGKIVTELILDGKPSLDITDLRFSRFAEGDLAKPKSVI